MKTTTQIQLTVLFNPTDSTGQDGDWAEGKTGREAVEQAQKNIECVRPGESLTALGYEVVDFSELGEVNDRSFEILRKQWVMSRRNGWTSDEADQIMRDEISRRANA